MSAINGMREQGGAGSALAKTLRRAFFKVLDLAALAGHDGDLGGLFGETLAVLRRQWFWYLAIVVVLLAYLWLDRWEPEPPRLLVFAFLWGASVAIVVSIVLEVVFEQAINPAATIDSDTSAFTVALGAPIIEEAAKGCFLLLMMTGRRRLELNSLTDCLVYAGLVAAGFAWIEDIFYIANAETVAASLVTAALRLVMAPFAHPLFTTFTGIGVYFALKKRNPLAKAGCILLGYLAAVLLHGVWNSSALFGIGAYFGVYAFFMVPIFGLVITLAVHSRRREQRTVAAKLPGMVTAGLVTANEATWLGSLATRKQAIAAAQSFGGKNALLCITLGLNNLGIIVSLSLSFSYLRLFISSLTLFNKS